MSLHLSSNGNGYDGMAAVLANGNGYHKEAEVATGPVGLSEAAARLRDRIEEKQAVIGVVGLGYVGLPLAVAFAGRGFRTLGIDLSRDRVARLRAGHNYIQDVEDDALWRAVETGHLVADAGYDGVGDADVVFICVPTPVTPHKDPDMTYIEGAARSIARHLRPGQLIILKSTTYPNTTEGLVLPILEEAAAPKGMRLGEDYFLAFSPERVDPGNPQFTTENTPIVVGGATKACTELAAKTLRQIVAQVHVVSSPKVAEMEKLLENIFRSVNIALVNELAQLCDRMGDVSIWEVVEAAATKPFGFMPFYPGPGLGGHCIPIDPYYLSWLARKYDFETSFITLAARVNVSMPYYVAEAVVRAIAEEPVGLKDARVLVLGVAFKRDVDDTRHAPALDLIRLLWDQGIRQVHYADPHVPVLEVPYRGHTVTLEALALDEDVLAAHDVVVIVTDHRAFSYPAVAAHARRIVDTRNALKTVAVDRDKVVLLGGGSAT